VLVVLDGNAKKKMPRRQGAVEASEGRSTRCPGERSSAETIRRGGITKTGNAHARRALVEGAWAYRMKARIGRHKVDRIEALPKVVRDIGWKAQVRLCTRYRRLSARGKTANVVNVAIAREMVGFIWSIACTVQSAPKTA
jgi:transposase